jgi:hypothetical protein
MLAPFAFLFAVDLPLPQFTSEPPDTTSDHTDSGQSTEAKVNHCTHNVSFIVITVKMW